MTSTNANPPAPQSTEATIEREEALRHIDADGYLWYQVDGGNRAGYHIDTPNGGCGWFGTMFFRTQDGRFRTRLEHKGKVATLILRA